MWRQNPEPQSYFHSAITGPHMTVSGALTSSLSIHVGLSHLELQELRNPHGRNWTGSLTAWWYAQKALSLATASVTQHWSRWFFPQTQSLESGKQATPFLAPGAGPRDQCSSVMKWRFLGLLPSDTFVICLNCSSLPYSSFLRHAHFSFMIVLAAMRPLSGYCGPERKDSVHPCLWI